MSEPTITREVVLDPSVIPPLDESLFTLSNREKDFLHKAIISNDEGLRTRILGAQRIAYAQHPYPCIRAFHFVSLMMSANPVYPKVLEDGKKGNTILLDLGCCMGTDARKLVSDGYPSSNVLGCDLRHEFIDAGYQLYQDSSTCSIRFFTSDIFDVPITVLSSPSRFVASGEVALSQVAELSQLRGSINHLYAGALFHLFDETTQYAIALRFGVLLQYEEGAIIFGRHQGLESEGLIDDHLGRNRYAHSPSSWPKLWKKVFTELVSEEFAEKKVVVDASFDESLTVSKDAFRAKQNTRMLVWSVRIM